MDSTARYEDFDCSGLYSHLPFHEQLSVGFRMATNHLYGPQKTTWSPIFFNNDWFYPSLIQFLESPSLVAILSLFTNLKSSSSPSTQHQSALATLLNLCTEELTRKRLRTFLQFQGKYYDFDAPTIVFTSISFISHIHELLEASVERIESGNSGDIIPRNKHGIPVETRKKPCFESVKHAWENWELFDRQIQMFLRSVNRILGPLEFVTAWRAPSFTVRSFAPPPNACHVRAHRFKMEQPVEVDYSFATIENLLLIPKDLLCPPLLYMSGFFLSFCGSEN